MSLGGKYGSTDSSSEVWDAQSPFLKDLYAQGSSLLGNQQNFINSIGQSGQQGIDAMGGINQQSMPAWGNQLAGGFIDNNKLGNFYTNMMKGKGTVMDTLTGMQNPEGNPYLQEMGQYGLDQMNENFARNIMPNINTNAAFTGGLGGSRQGIAQGVAAGDLAGEQASYLNNFYGSQYQSDMDRAAQAAQLMGGLQQGAAAGFGGMQSQMDQNQMRALGLTPQMLQSQMAPAMGYQGIMQGQWSPYQAYSGVLGQPTVLNESETRNYGFDIGFGSEPEPTAVG